MIYWDNAATTWPKPTMVIQSMGQALRRYGANPGRAGHRMAMETAQQVYGCRQEVADFFGLSDPSGVVFTANCTTSLNMVIAGVMSKGGSVLCSDLEHNAVVRPLAALSKGSTNVDVVEWCADSAQLVERFRKAIRPDTKLLVCTHCSNVFGVIMPIRELGELAHEHGVLFCVDAAQSAGVLPLNMEQYNIDYLCVAPHKGLYAAMGTGILLCRETEKIPPWVRGGTGSNSKLPEQPTELPDRLESGTPNTPGICSIRAGIRFVKELGIEHIHQQEIACLQRVYERLAGCKSVRFYTPYPTMKKSASVLSLNIDEIPSEDVARRLDTYGIAVRAGLHCAPWAHRHFGSLDTGTVRLAPSVFSTLAEAEKISKVFLQIAEKSLH